MYCPNPECPERQLEGPPSEYAAHITRCPICGSYLVAQPPDVATPDSLVQSHGLYHDEWQDYRQRRRKRWLWFLLWPVFGSVAFSIHFQFPRSLLANAMAAAVLASYLVSLGTAEYRYQTWPCPKCHRAFMGWWFFSWEYARSCLHCGLPKWEGE